MLDLQATVTARQKLESQQQENKGVQKVPPPPILFKLPTNTTLSGIRPATSLIANLQAHRLRPPKARAQRSRHGRGRKARIYRQGDVRPPIHIQHHNPSSIAPYQPSPPDTSTLSPRHQSLSPRGHKQPDIHHANTSLATENA